MSVNPDPYIEKVRDPLHDAWSNGAECALVQVVSIEDDAAVTHPHRWTFVIGAMLILAMVRVPAASAPRADARTISARLAKGELHLISLGRASLRARASAPNGMPPITWGAEGHIITAFQNTKGTGVRTSW